MANKAQLAAYLAGHIGASRGVAAAVIARDLGAEERHIRTLVSELREDGLAIAAHPKLGYFVAESAAELELCCKFLRARALHSLHLEAQMRRVSLAELLGQLRLNT